LEDSLDCTAQDIRRIKKKMNKIIKANIILNNTIKVNNNKYTEVINESYDNKKTLHNSKYNIINNFSMNKLYSNAMICLSSGFIYFAFNKYINRATKYNHTIAIFKPMFIFTFCITPIFISLYFTKLDYDYIQNN